MYNICVESKGVSLSISLPCLTSCSCGCLGVSGRLTGTPEGDQSLLHLEGIDGMTLAKMGEGVGLGGLT